MKVDFDKLTLSQMIYLISGLFLAIFVLMVSGQHAARLAIVIVLFTAVVVFLLKYKTIKIIFNIIAIAGIVIIIYILINGHIRAERKEYKALGKEKLYAICEASLPASMGGIVEEHLIKCPDEETCLKELTYCKTLGKNRCVVEDERISKIFNNEPVSGWYIRVEPKNKKGKPQALVYKYSDLFYKIFSPGKARTCTEVRASGLREFLREKEENLDIHIVSPEGEVIRR